MAFFGVTIETISEVTNHPDPEVTRMSLAKVDGMSFQFVIGKDQFKVGDKVIYFPIDSVFPEDLLIKMNMVGKLTGKNKNRLKTVLLRKALSQGLVFPIEQLLTPEQAKLSSEEITAFLGITKYEPPVNMTPNGTLISLPEGYSTYDIEGADRNQEIIDLMMDMEVIVMEKMEGTNHSAGKNETGIFVNQRNNSIVEDKGVNSYWQVARDTGLLEKIQSSSEKDLSVMSEFCGPGVNGNIYKLKKHTLYTFDVKVNFRWLDFDNFEKFTKSNDLLIAPILFRGTLRDFLNGKTVQEASDGFSVVNPEQLREGIVIKPVIEQRHPKLGRLIIKQRSPKYLAGSEY